MFLIFKDLKKEGAEGNKKIIQLTRYGTVIIAVFQSFGLAAYFWSIKGDTGNFIVLESSTLFFFVTVLTLVTGTIFVMWLGEQITDYGIGNGISLIITVGILAAAPNTFGALFSSMYEDPEGKLLFGIVLIILLGG